MSQKNVEAMVKGLEALARLANRLDLAMDNLTPEEMTELFFAKTETPFGVKEARFLTEDVVTVVDEFWGFTNGT